jgi:hypothetical protein
LRYSRILGGMASWQSRAKSKSSCSWIITPSVAPSPRLQRRLPLPSAASSVAFPARSDAVFCRQMDKNEISPRFRKLYPTLNEEQLREAQENLDRFLEVVLRVCQRIQSDPDARKQFEALTSSDDPSSIRNERSHSSHDPQLSP